MPNQNESDQQEYTEMSIATGVDGLVSRGDENYNKVQESFSERGRYKTAGYMAHGYELEPVTDAAILQRNDMEKDGKCLIVLSDGRLFVGDFCYG